MDKVLNDTQKRLVRDSHFADVNAISSSKVGEGGIEDIGIRRKPQIYDGPYPAKA
jgi:hypothetical protein